MSETTAMAILGRYPAGCGPIPQPHPKSLLENYANPPAARVG